MSRQIFCCSSTQCCNTAPQPSRSIRLKIYAFIGWAVRLDAYYSDTSVHLPETRKMPAIPVPEELKRAPPTWHFGPPYTVVREDLDAGSRLTLAASNEHFIILQRRTLHSTVESLQKPEERYFMTGDPGFKTDDFKGFQEIDPEEWGKMREYVGNPSASVQFVCVGNHKGIVSYDLVLYEDLDELESLDAGEGDRQEGEHEDDEDEDEAENNRLERMEMESTDEEYGEEESDDDL